MAKYRKTNKIFVSAKVSSFKVFFPLSQAMLAVESAILKTIRNHVSYCAAIKQLLQYLISKFQQLFFSSERFR